MQKACCLAVLLLLGVLALGSCNELVSDCVDHPAWCKPFELQPVDYIDRAIDPTVRLRLVDPQAVPPYPDTQFRIWVEQDGSGAGLDNPSGELPTKQVSLTDLFPSKNSLHCGDAQAYLYARKISPSLAAPGNSDPQGGKYLQHGKLVFHLIHRGSDKYQRNTITNTSWVNPISKMALRSSSGGLQNLFLSIDVLQKFLGSVPVDLINETQIQAPGSFLTGLQLLDVTTKGMLILDFKSPPSTLLLLCPQLFDASNMLGTSGCWTSRPDLPWASGATSTAADIDGRHIAIVDNNSILHTVQLNINSSANNLSIINSISYPSYRFVSIGNLDGTGAADVLALVDGGGPPLILYDGVDKAYDLAAKLTAVDPLLSYLGASVVAFGKLNGCSQTSQTDLLFASGNQLRALVAADGLPLATSKALTRVPITLSPEIREPRITALLLSGPYLIIVAGSGIGSDQMLYVYQAN